jgi:hypothetical protein
VNLDLSSLKIEQSESQENNFDFERLKNSTYRSVTVVEVNNIMHDYKRDSIINKDSFQSINEQSPSPDDKYTKQRITTLRESMVSLDFKEEEFLNVSDQ